MFRAIVLTLTLLSGSAFAQNKFMAIMGGGGEPEGNTTIFDEDMTEVGSFLNANSAWQPTISFNGGHATTESIIDKGIGRRGVTNTRFTQEAYDQTIQQYKDKILSGDIKSGDQLLVWISSHGAIQESGETSHSISVSGGASANLTDLSDSTLVQVDKLQELITLANARGIKLGVLDFSCHSGASIALSNPNTCVISSSGPKHFGYSNWGGLFGENMKRGKSLEDVFLDTLDDRNDPAFPMISSPVGQEIQNQIYPDASPFFYTYSDNMGHNKLTPFIEGQVQNNQCEVATTSFNQLLQLSRDVESMMTPANSNRGPNYNSFRQAVTEYYDLQQEMRTNLQGMNITELETNTENICAVFNFTEGDFEENQCQEYTHKEILATDFNAELTRLRNQKTGLTGNDAAWIDTQMEWMRLAEAKKAELLAANPAYAQYSNYYQSLPGLEDRTWELASEVSEQTQKLYKDMYAFKSRTDQRPNPCKDFVL